MPLCHEGAKADRPEGFGVQTMIQLGGRGRRGNVWESPLGNLYCSILLRPNCDAQKAGQLSFVMAVAMADAFKPYIGAGTLSLKWPNDILVDGKKLAGILIESQTTDDKIDALVIGFGVNIFAPPESAIGLTDCTNKRLVINAVRDEILNSLSRRYEQWQADGFAPIQKSWLAHAYGRGQSLTACLAHREVTGIFEGLNENGALVLTDKEGQSHEIHAAEIYFGETA